MLLAASNTLIYTLFSVFATTLHKITKRLQPRMMGLESFALIRRQAAVFYQSQHDVGNLWVELSTLVFFKLFDNMLF